MQIIFLNCYFYCDYILRVIIVLALTDFFYIFISSHEIKIFSRMIKCHDTLFFFSRAPFIYCTWCTLKINFYVKSIYWHFQIRESILKDAQYVSDKIDSSNRIDIILILRPSTTNLFRPSYMYHLPLLEDLPRKKNFISLKKGLRSIWSS